MTERCSVNDNNGILHQGLGSDQLIVASVVHDIDDTCLSGDGLATPGKVASVQPQGTELFVSTPASDGVDAPGAQLGHGGGTADLELPLLSDRALLTTGGPALMPVVTRNTHSS